MPAKVISFEQWKAAHPPSLICFQHGLACALAWQQGNPYRLRLTTSIRWSMPWHRLSVRR